MPCPPALTPSLLCHTPPPYPRLLQAALGQAKAPALPTVTTAPSALPADTTASVGSGGPSTASTTAPLRPRVVPLLETSTFAKESLRGLNSPRSRLPRLGGAQTAQAGGLGNASPRAFLPSAPGTPTRAQRVLKFLKDAPYMGEMPLRIHFFAHTLCRWGMARKGREGRVYLWNKITMGTLEAARRAAWGGGVFLPRKEVALQT